MKVTIRDIRAQRAALPVLRTATLPPPPSSDDWILALGLAGKAVLTIDEAAELLRVSERTLRERIRTGDVPSLHIGRRILVPVPHLVTLLLGHEAPEEQ